MPWPYLTELWQSLECPDRTWQSCDSHYDALTTREHQQHEPGGEADVIVKLSTVISRDHRVNMTKTVLKTKKQK